MNLKDFLIFGEASESEKTLIKAVCNAAESVSDSKNSPLHLEISIHEIDDGLNEITIRMIEGNSYKRLRKLLDEQLAKEAQENGGIH